MQHQNKYTLTSQHFSRTTGTTLFGGKTEMSVIICHWTRKRLPVLGLNVTIVPLMHLKKHQLKLYNQLHPWCTMQTGCTSFPGIRRQAKMLSSFLESWLLSRKSRFNSNQRFHILKCYKTCWSNPCIRLGARKINVSAGKVSLIHQSTVFKPITGHFAAITDWIF